MKNLLIALVMGLAIFATPVWADRPDIDIKGDVVIDYDIDIDIQFEADGTGTVNQFLEDSTVSATSLVKRNNLMFTPEIIVDSQAVGNLSNVEVTEVDTTVVQSVQWSDVTALSSVRNNLINPQAYVEVTATALGNAAYLDVTKANQTVVQLVEGSDISATAELINNSFGCGGWNGCQPIDPVVQSTAVGNLTDITNFSAQSPVSVTQFTIKGSNVSATSRVLRNTGRVGPLNVGSVAIGNSASVGVSTP
jgi:hypothetical protein